MTHRFRVRVGSAALLTARPGRPGGVRIGPGRHDHHVPHAAVGRAAGPGPARRLPGRVGHHRRGGRRARSTPSSTDVQVAAAAGLPAADVIFLTEDAPSNIIATGNVEPLDDLIASNGTDMSQFEKVDFWQLDGAQIGIPVYSQLVMMDYNTAKLAEAGFDAPPTTWAELDRAGPAIKEQGIEEYPISFGAIDWSWYLMALSMGDPMFDADLNPVFADEGSEGPRRDGAAAELVRRRAHHARDPRRRSVDPARELLGRHGHVPPGLAGLGRASATTRTSTAGAERRVHAPARRALHLVAAGGARHRHGQPQPRCGLRVHRVVHVA